MRQLSQTFSRGDEVVVQTADFDRSLEGRKGVAVNTTTSLLDNSHSMWVAVEGDVSPTRWFYIEEIRHADPMTAYLRSFSGE